MIFTIASKHQITRGKKSTPKTQKYYCKKNEKLSQYTMFMDWKTQYCNAVNYPLIYL